MNCHHCHGTCIKKGWSKTTQKYQCKNCLKYQRLEYVYQSYRVSDQQIVILTKEGCGIKSTSRILNISPITVINRILKIGNTLMCRIPVLVDGIYEVDELFTYLGNKKNRICIVYSINHATKEVIDIAIGKRNKTNLCKVISTLLLSKAKKIVTDKLNLYTALIPHEFHSTKHRGINRIERMNLNLRTHLKRLNRKTICYSKSLVVLMAIVRIYFWY